MDDILKLDPPSRFNTVDPKCFVSPDFSGKRKVNIGSGRRDCSEWICVDELDATGVTKVSFSEDSQFPIVGKTVSLFYSSHFLEHISDEVVQQILSEMTRCASPGALFILKIPDFSWFLEQYKFTIRESMNQKGIESVLWSWRANGVKDNFENRIAMMFCGYWNKDYGDHFSGNINGKSNQAFHGPPRLEIREIQQILSLNAPHKIAQQLVLAASKETTLQTFNHRNAWSEEELAELFTKFDIEILHNKTNLICNQFKNVIPDLEAMQHWSAYYLCKLPD